MVLIGAQNTSCQTRLPTRDFDIMILVVASVSFVLLVQSKMIDCLSCARHEAGLIDNISSKGLAYVQISEELARLVLDTSCLTQKLKPRSSFTIQILLGSKREAPVRTIIFSAEVVRSRDRAE